MTPVSEERGAFQCNGRTVDPAGRLVRFEGRELKVQKRVFDLLTYLVEHRDRVVGKQELLDRVWTGRITTEHVLARAVMKARQALGDDSRRQCVIRTVHGDGYRFVGSLEPVSAEDADPAPARADRKRSPRLPLAWAIPLLALIGAGFLALTSEQQAPASAERAGDAAFAVRPWRRAEALFQHDPHWRGGDGGISVDLGAGRIAWFFSDSFVTSEPRWDREDAVMVRNTVAIQTGYDPATAGIGFHWKGEPGEPGSFFPEKDGAWYWPVNAVGLEERIIVIMVESRAVETGLGFEHTRTVAAVITNPLDPPSEWRIDELALPANGRAVLLGYSAVVEEGEHVYAFSKQELTQDVYLARWSRADLAIGDASALQWWGGRERGWLAPKQGLAMAAPVLTDTATPFSLRFDARAGRYLMLGSWGFGQAVIALRSAPALTGPWSDRSVVYRPAEEYRPGILIYGGRIHEGLAGADLVVSYDVNSERFTELLQDTSIYFPRFLRVNLEPSVGEGRTAVTGDPQH